MSHDVEMSYIFRYVENLEKDGMSGVEAWPIRKTGLYQKFSTTSLQSHSIVIAPSIALENQITAVFIKKSLPTVDYPRHWTNFHMLCLNSFSSNWRSYIDYLAGKIEEIVSTRAYIIYVTAIKRYFRIRTNFC